MSGEYDAWSRHLVWYTRYLNYQFECAQIIAQQCNNAHKQKLAHVAEYILKKRREITQFNAFGCH